MTKKTIYILVAIIFIVGGSYLPFVGLPFQSESGDSAYSVLGRLLLIALIIERCFDVFVELWRGPEKIKIKLEVFKLKEEIEYAPDENSKRIKINEKINKDIELQSYEDETRKISMWIIFLFCLLVSISGVRSLDALLSSPTISLQLWLFKAIDIILTGGIIAGGSDGIHEIMIVYKKFMKESQEKIEDRRKARNVL